MFKYSQDIKSLSLEELERVLKHTVTFAQALSDFGGMNKGQIDQEIIKRSKNQMRGLFDLFTKFLDVAKEADILDSFQNLEDVMSHVLGSERKHEKFTDVGGFLKRVEWKYALYLGEIKTQVIIDGLLKALSEIPEEHGAYLASDIARFLTNYTETMSKLEIKDIERVLTRSLIFTRSLDELDDLNREEINQFIINRSKHKIRNLFELFQKFLITENPLPLKSKTPSFNDVVVYILGKYEGPKTIEEASSIHDLMADYHKDFPIAVEHDKWSSAMDTIIPRYLEILQNEEGEQLIDQLWNVTLPGDQIVEKYKEKILELPREDENNFLFRLINLLTRPVLKKKKKDRALAGAIAYKILGKIYAELSGGRNIMIRSIKLNQLLKDRKFADTEKKEFIDEYIYNIVKEDLDGIKKRSMIIRSIIPVLTIKGYYIKAFDISTNLYPELFVDVFSGVDPLSNIGKKYLKSQKQLNTLGNINAFFYFLTLTKRFHKDYFIEAQTVPLDAVKKRKTILEFFESIFPLYDNVEVSKFYDYHISGADRLTLIYIMKYLYESLQKAFDLIDDFMGLHKDHIKLMSMDYYLSNLKLKEAKMSIDVLQEDIRNTVSEGFAEDSEKMKRLENMLEQQKSDISKYRFMDELNKEAGTQKSVLESRIIFCKELLTFLDMVKEVNTNLPAIFPQYFERITDFKARIDEIISKIKKVYSKNLISNADFQEKNQAAIVSKNRLSELAINSNFMDHLKRFSEASQKEILFVETIEIETLQEEPIEIIEEINPLLEFFEKYKEELMAVASTSSLEIFTDVFNFWLKENILPLTKNKAEEMLLKRIFKKIKKRYLSEEDSSNK